MIAVSHPTGNTFVRALLLHAEEKGMLSEFHTTVGRAGYGGGRRVHPVSPSRLRLHPFRELTRLALGGPLRMTGWTRTQARLVDWVYSGLDRAVSRQVSGMASRGVKWLYCYEDGALETFQRAKEMGLGRAYDLPIAWWEESRRLLAEEALRWPEWAPTLGAPDDSLAKLERKTREIELAQVIFCPSEFVRRSIPDEITQGRKIIVAPFGTPETPMLPERCSSLRNSGPLKVLFAGTLGQRKGLADLFAAFRLLGTREISLTLLGAPLLPLSFYRRAGVPFEFAPPRDHAGVLHLMRQMELLALPSIVEGRALVQQEAMSCGLPVLATPNAGAEDLVVNEQTGFLVPIRDPEAIAERLEWCLKNREKLREMGACAAEKAALLTWKRYAETILDGLTTTAGPGQHENYG